MMEAFLMIYVLGLCLFPMLAVAYGDWQVLLVAPIWPLVIMKLWYKYLRDI